MKTSMADYLESLRVRHYSAATVKSREQSLRSFQTHLESVGVADLRAVNRETLVDYQRELLRVYSVGTVRVLLAGVRHFFAHLENTDAILLNPTLGVPLPKEERRLPKRILQPSEVRKVLSAPDESPKGIRDRALLELFYSSGIRREEMARLTLPDVDIKNGFVRVTRGKGARDRVVPIGPCACDALARYLKDARAVWLKARRNPGWTDALWLSPIQPHGPMKKEAVALIIQRHARRALDRNVSPHLWRHSCATHLLKNNANLRHVQEMLGHKSLATTERYLRLTITDLKEAHRKFHPREQQQRRKAAQS